MQPTAADAPLSYLFRQTGLRFSITARNGDKINYTPMQKKNVRFVAVKTVKKPATVRFKTKSGKTVSFKAVKTFAKKQVVVFRAKKK